MKGFPLNRECVYVRHCTRDEGRTDCGRCPLHPKAAKAETRKTLLQCSLPILILFTASAILVAVARFSGM